ncbi:hypothetical protein H6F88_19205 [Oculatella sp. FACHB-28]|uniref:hypothetical protein n=1 Tax=Oculatella sp. FACHB-28 TaxID=2692845 RepID=UPI00168950C4|nr:hypothetical protein [Oculatella sp. FACHB-28]MBD2058114.1 hypothetical protein [Oculatella sp. FACHB-28]
MGVFGFRFKYQSGFFSLVGGIGLACFGSIPEIQRDGLRWFTTPTGRVFAISAALTTAGTIGSFKETEKIEALEKEIANLESLLELRTNFFQTIRKLLEQFANEMNFSGTERISVYFHDGVDKFVPIGRYSENPVFQRIGRSSYPENEGCIGRAWHDGQGEAFVDDLPDPNHQLSDYLERVKRDWRINKEVVKRFVMKSRTYYGCAIKSEELPTRRIAVIIIESTEEKAFEKAALKSKMNSSFYFNTLRQFIILTSFIKLSPDQAKAEGY